MDGSKKIGASERMRKRLDESGPAQRVQIIAPQAWIDLVEEWRATQRPVPNMSAAIRKLVELGYESEKRGKERR